MDFGLHLGTRGATAGPEGLRAMACHCEALGYGYLGFNDHIVIAKAVESKYPYDKSGLWPAADTGTCLEQLMTIAYVAAVTENIRLLTSVMVLPHRAPVLAAKMLATADVLSRGRLTVGVGIGWFLDRWLDTTPWLLIVFLFLGIGAGLSNAFRLAKKYGAELAQREEVKGGKPPRKEDE
mgnify:CR=1 FL=1